MNDVLAFPSGEVSTARVWQRLPRLVDQVSSAVTGYFCLQGQSVSIEVDPQGSLCHPNQLVQSAKGTKLSGLENVGKEGSYLIYFLFYPLMKKKKGYSKKMYFVVFILGIFSIIPSQGGSHLFQLLFVLALSKKEKNNNVLKKRIKGYSLIL